MKKLMFVLTLMLLFAFSAGAQVPISSPIQFYAGGGLSFPGQPDGFKDLYKNGYHGFLGASMSVFPKVSALGKVEYHSFSNDIDNTDGGTLKIAMFGVDARVSLGLPTMPISPFVIAGIGFANIKQAAYEFPSGMEDIPTGAFEDQTKMYYNFGGGVERKLMGPVTIFGMAHWVTIMADDDDMNFWALSAGVKLL